ncbi:MAG: aminomethyl-transferring glycine dehydrogenase subunit GcvPB [Chlamydiia bacterium]|nr:aminomethyl-transferring glycine dehydrogenase subunit GcvPB [Chlamydiia bacterium]
MSVFDQSEQGQKAWSLPTSEDAFEVFSPDENLKRKSEVKLPEISEINLTRHFNFLAKRNMGIDTHFYPLGSCTMKLNPRINETAAQLPGFQRTHPLAPDQEVQGNLELMWELTELLADAGGFSAGTLSPNSGAQGEFCGIQMIKAYHESRNEDRDEILVPDNAHGTNPATASMAGYKIVTIKTGPNGDMNLEDLRKHTSSKTAGLMLTNPNTLGLFSPNIQEISKIVHAAGGLLYYDGANLNPILYVVRPGDMGFDVMHINLHKTFSTPHGGGGPGSGPVLCNDKLKAFLPLPKVEKTENGYRRIEEDKNSIGRICTFNGNFAVYLRAYLYFKMHGKYGLRKIAEMAVLNANYLKHHFARLFKVPYPQPCMHEFVVQADRFLDKGIKAQDLAKRMLDYGYHPPTTYFPLIVKECLLVEPTESESKKTLDHFIEAIEAICRECEESPELVKEAPHTKPITRVDEVRANRSPKLRH